SPRIATKPAIRTRPVSCAAASTFSSGRRRLFRPPRKSPAPQATLEAKASSRTDTAAHLHRGASNTLPARIRLGVVGSIAFDAVRTPFGERDRMLGGSAVHFSLASSFFTDV